MQVESVTVKFDIRRAVQLDETLHGERLIRLEFAGASLLFAALVALAIRYEWDTIREGNTFQVSPLVMAVWFAGLAINYLVLLWLSRGPLPAKDAAARSDLRSLMWRLSLLILLPGACAVVAWRQRPSRNGR